MAPDGWLATASKCEHCSHFAAHRDSTLYPGLRDPASEGQCLRIPRLIARRCLSCVPLKSMAACGASCTHRKPTDSSDSALAPQIVQTKMPPKRLRSEMQLAALDQARKALAAVQGHKSARAARFRAPTAPSSIGISAASPAEAAAAAPAASAAAEDARALAALAAERAVEVLVVPLRFGMDFERHAVVPAIKKPRTTIAANEIARARTSSQCRSTEGCAYMLRL